MLMTMMCPNCRHRFPVSGCCTVGPHYDTKGLPPQDSSQNPLNRIHAWKEEEDNLLRLSNYQLNTPSDLTCGSVTITTPKIQSGGCCLVQRSSSDLSPQSIFFNNYSEGVTTNVRCFKETLLTNKAEETRPISPPSGCQELPGIRRNSSVKMPEHRSSSRIISNVTCCSDVTGFSSNSRLTEGDSMRIQVSATVEIPANMGECTVNITTKANPRLEAESARATVPKSTGFNGGGLVQADNVPSSPVSWLMPFSYEPDSTLKDLAEIKRVLNNSGWYHEELSWQQSKDLLKNAPVGQWLMRNSSDARYTFAVSVQTSKGPTSVRVLYAYGKFRLDSDPRLAGAIRAFDCPIKMLEYYTKSQDHRDEVWVDNSGTFFSQIILTKPLVKEVRSLVHLSRLVINKFQLNTKNLPTPIKNYLAEYPFAF